VNLGLKVKSASYLRRPTPTQNLAPHTWLPESSSKDSASNPIYLQVARTASSRGQDAFKPPINANLSRGLYSTFALFLQKILEIGEAHNTGWMLLPGRCQY